MRALSAEGRFLSRGCVLYSDDCHVDVEPQRPLDPGLSDEQEAEPDDDDDNDFYRQYGDVPSTGIGH